MGVKRNAGSDPETGGLTQQERGHSAEAIRVRISAEHIIGNIKRYVLMRKRYHGTPTSSTTSSVWSPDWWTSNGCGMR